MLFRSSVSVSATFKDIKYKGEFQEKIEELSKDLEGRLKRAKVVGLNLTVTFKDTSFNTKQK
jgi:hypothetical protein